MVDALERIKDLGFVADACYPGTWETEARRIMSSITDWAI